MIHFHNRSLPLFWRIIGAALLFLAGLSPIYVLAHPNRHYYLCVGGIPAGLDVADALNVSLLGWVGRAQIIQIEF